MKKQFKIQDGWQERLAVVKDWHDTSDFKQKFGKISDPFAAMVAQYIVCESKKAKLPNSSILIRQLRETLDHIGVPEKVLETGAGPLLDKFWDQNKTPTFKEFIKRLELYSMNPEKADNLPKLLEFYKRMTKAGVKKDAKKELTTAKTGADVLAFKKAMPATKMDKSEGLKAA